VPPDVYAIDRRPLRGAHSASTDFAIRYAPNV